MSKYLKLLKYLNKDNIIIDTELILLKCNILIDIIHRYKSLCNQSNTRKWRLKNPEKFKAMINKQSKNYYHNNESFRLKKKQYNELNKDKIKEYKKEYNRKKREKLLLEKQNSL